MTVRATPPSKISVKIWRPVLDSLSTKIDAACLRRDAYLNKVLAIEIPRLDDELTIPNSIAAQAFVSQSLDKLDRKLVSLSLQPELVEQLDVVCKRKRIVRDAFFNRLFLLLSAKPKTIDTLLFEDENWRTEVWSEFKHDGPFFQNTFHPLDPDIDPFWPIRCGIDLYRGGGATPFDYVEPESATTVKVQKGFTGAIEPLDSLYTKLFALKFKTGQDLYGLNCYLPDHEVPDHPAALRLRQTLDELLDDVTAPVKPGNRPTAS